LEDKLRGKCIVLDGPDGCGKTTHTKLLAEWLQKQGVPTVSFRDPGGTAIGEKIRQILLSCEHSTMSTAAEVLLYMAARVQLWQEKIEPALENNQCVVLDRWLSSTCAYQGYAGGFKMRNVINIAEICLERPWPDLTIILDVDLKTAAKRLKRGRDRMEQKGDDYHEKVRQGFWELANKREDFVFIDATGDIETVHEKIVEVVKAF